MPVVMLFEPLPYRMAATIRGMAEVPNKHARWADTEERGLGEESHQALGLPSPAPKPVVLFLGQHDDRLGSLPGDPLRPARARQPKDLAEAGLCVLQLPYI